MLHGKRLAAALLGASAALMLSVMPANAAGEEWTIDLGTDNAGVEVGGKVNLVDADGKDESFHTSLKGLNLGNTKLTTYCIQIDTLIPRDAKDRPKMVEAPWDAYPDANSPFRKNNAKINWVLHNSYPSMDIVALRKALADNGVTIKGELSVAEAITATQAAIWSFSDNKKLSAHNADNVVALFNFLTGDKNTGKAQPTPSLEITPKKLTGEIGKLVGPFKVATTADKITKLTPKLPDGVTITDKDGKALAESALKNGSEIFVSVPANATAGEGSFTLEATAPVSTGRVFVSNGVKSQSLIVAQNSNAKLTAAATANWAAASHPTTPPAPQASNGGLANTGVSIFVPIGIGVLLLAAGAGALLFLRRRGRA